MNRKAFYVLVIVLLAAMGAYWHVQSKNIDKATIKFPEIKPEQMPQVMPEFGFFPYVCNDGLEFTMAPANDKAYVKLAFGPNGPFPETKLLYKDNLSGVRFEGSGMVFVGAGESARLSANGKIYTCEPKTTAGITPYNFGDSAEGGGVKQDAVQIVSESIGGKWQSVDDSKFIREFTARGIVQDSYDGKVVSEGTWSAANAGQMFHAPPASPDDSIYLQLSMSKSALDSRIDVLNFKLVKLTPEELELTYLDRGGTLRFKKIK